MLFSNNKTVGFLFMSVLFALHVLAAVIWVGGMFFAYTTLRPVAGSLLEPPQRLALWRRVLERFFAWVWTAVVVLFASGYWMVFGYLGGFGAVGIHVHIMHLLAIVMALIYAYLFFAPYQRLQRQVDAGDWPAAGATLAQIRKLVGTNLLIGLVLVSIAAGGRWA